MGSFLDEIGAAIQQTACAVIATNDAVNGFMEGISFPGAESYRDTTRALRRQLCSNDDDVVPTPGSPPLQDCLEQLGDLTSIGGVLLKRTATNGNSSTFCVRELVGTSLQGVGDSQRRWEFIDCQGNTDTRIQDLPPNLVTQEVTAESAGCCIGEQNPFTGCDGVAPIPPYTPSPTTVNIEYENNENVTINEDVDITIFAPQVNLVGGIFAPVTVAGNTFQLVGTVNLSPKFGLELNPEINLRGGGGGPDVEPPLPDIDSPEPTEDPTERRVIVGAVVTATSVSSRQDFLPQGENPDIGIPNLGYCSFYVATNATRSWTADIPVKNVRSYIPCPAAGGAIDVATTGRSGIALQVEPVWAYPGQQL